MIMYKLLIFFAIMQFSLGSTNYSTTEPQKILSRKRRYLVFPEGSSLQLVYCLTMPSLGMGKIFTIGSTAAMAWILPSEPMVFLDKKHKKHQEEKPSIDNHNNLGYNHEIDDYEPSFLPEDYYSKYSSGIVSPHGMNDDQSKYYNFNGYNRVDRPKFGQFSRYPDPNIGQQWIEPQHWHVYRRTRRSLYGKLEKLLNALSKDGRSCILKLICEVSQVADRKGTFMEEIVKVIFRIKTHDHMKNEDMYDVAANKRHNCNERYKSCPESFFGRW